MYLLLFLHPQSRPVVTCLLQVRRFLLCAQCSPLLDDLLVSLVPGRVLCLPLRMVHIGVQHSWYGSTRAKTFVSFHFFGRTLVVGGRHYRRRCFGFAAFGYRDPRAGRFRESRTELRTTAIKNSVRLILKNSMHTISSVHAFQSHVIISPKNRCNISTVSNILKHVGSIYQQLLILHI